MVQKGLQRVLLVIRVYGRRFMDESRPDMGRRLCNIGSFETLGLAS